MDVPQDSYHAPPPQHYRSHRISHLATFSLTWSFFYLLTALLEGGHDVLEALHLRLMVPQVPAQLPLHVQQLVFLARDVLVLELQLL